MILLLDIGNSLAKWRITRAGETWAEGAMPSAGLGDAHGFPWDGYQPEAAIIASVVSKELGQRLVNNLETQGVRARLLVAEAASHGLINQYDLPNQLGPDRYATLVAAHRRQLGDCIVACVGSALTADALTAKGAFLGGAILPGPDLMRAALAGGTARLAVARGKWGMPPRCTEDAVETGMLLAIAGVIEGMRNQTLNAEGAPPPVILSGGARHGLAAHLRPPVLEVENIVLEGLRWIARDLGYDA